MIFLRVLLRQSIVVNASFHFEEEEPVELESVSNNLKECQENIEEANKMISDFFVMFTGMHISN